MAARLQMLEEEIDELKAEYALKLVELEAKLPEYRAAAIQEADEKAAAATAHAQALRASLTPQPVQLLIPPAPAPAPAPATLPVFSLLDADGLKSKTVRIEDSKDFVAFSYMIHQDIGHAFNNMTEKVFKEHLCTIERIDTGALINKTQAATIYSTMKMLAANKGMPIVVAVAKPHGGGLEIRRITGDYTYSPTGIVTRGGGNAYFHQYSTEFVRKLTVEESKAVSAARKNPYALHWTCPIVL